MRIAIVRQATRRGARFHNRSRSWVESCSHGPRTEGSEAFYGPTSLKCMPAWEPPALRTSGIWAPPCLLNRVPATTVPATAGALGTS